MRSIRFHIPGVVAIVLVVAAGVHATANGPNLPNPFRGKVESVTPKNVVVVGDMGPTGSFVIQAGTKILRDGKKINAEQMFVGDPILVKFTTDKHRGGGHRAVEIWVGKLPGHSTGTRHKSK